MRILFLLILLNPFCGFSQLRLADIFTDHMVLQRERPIRFWGTFVPGEKLTVEMGTFKAETTVGIDASWHIEFPAQPANKIPQQVIVSSRNNQIKLVDVLVGDIWVCIGQSNMEWPMHKESHYREAFPDASQSLVRFFNPGYAGKNTTGAPFTDSILSRLHPSTFYQGAWEPCDTISLRTMSAVAYYFGRMILSHTEVPIGLINLSIGGAPLESFIDVQSLAADSLFVRKVEGDWLRNDALPVWVRERGMQNVGGLDKSPGDALGRHHGYKPGFAFEAGVKPLFPLPVKGILCYQGESNAQELDRVNEYAALTQMMVRDYRRGWQDSTLPFYYVQLSSIDTARYKGHLWPVFRNEQRKIMTMLPHSGMAVCSDIGAKNDVHPTNKKDVGERLARWALKQTYHRPIMPSGPLPLKANYKKGKLTIGFQYSGAALKTADGQVLRGFSLDGKTEVKALVVGKKVVISTPNRPDHIYYGWTPYSTANLVNPEGLPASTFRIKVE